MFNQWMLHDLTAEEVCTLLKVERHATCGFRASHLSATNELRPSAFQHHFLTAGRRARALFHGRAGCAGATPSHPQRSALSPLPGRSIEVLMLQGNGTSERVVVGPDLSAGQCVQLLTPGNTFHTARVIGQRRWFLGASTEWPGVEKVDVEIGDVEALAAKYPDVADDLRAFQRG